PMRVGLFYQIQVPKPWTAESEATRIHEALEQICYAEEMGFESVWFSEHHFRPVWSHNSAPDLTLAAVSQRTSRLRLGIGVVLAPIHHPLHVAARMATLDILSRGRVDVGIGRTGYPYQLTPYGTNLHDTRGMWNEFAEVLPRMWTEEVFSYQGKYYQIPPREVLPKPVQKPHPPLWSACSSDETARLTGSLGCGALFGSEGGPKRVEHLMGLYQESLRNAPPGLTMVNRHTAMMTAGFCHDDRHVVAQRGTELVTWYLEQQRERARLVWRDFDPSTVPPDYQGYYERDQRLASGPHPGEPTPQEIIKQGTSFCMGTPDECIRFLELYEALGIEEVFLLCAIGPAAHQEVRNTIRLFGECVIPHFQKRACSGAA
ncbi:MAG TPA: LLM class flavin-dependent oxidoreductase, partial [Candidatus Saccharimonadia bacterium]|nr:LLM class flavin-dependent oxidoreductase [Candidatus Saccharimonadia bacterium]